MSNLSLPDKTFLEAVLGMGGGYVLDLTNTSFAQLFDDLAIDIYDDKYAEYGASKANRLRTLWKIGSASESRINARYPRRLHRSEAVRSGLLRLPRGDHGRPNCQNPKDRGEA